MYKNILIPTDGSELSGKALAHGIALAKTLGAKLTVLTTTPPFHTLALNPEMLTDTPSEYSGHAKRHAETILAAASQAARAAEVDCTALHIEEEHPYEAIIRTAVARGCDLILMASHGRRGVSALLIGSETVKVLTHSKIPVLVYR